MRSFVATLVSIALFLVFFSLYYGLALVFADAFVIGRWDEASWWEPFGSFGVTMLYLILGGALLAADVCAGVWVWRKLDRWCGDG